MTFVSSTPLPGNTTNVKILDKLAADGKATVAKYDSSGTVVASLGDPARVAANGKGAKVTHVTTASTSTPNGFHLYHKGRQGPADARGWHYIYDSDNMWEGTSVIRNNKLYTSQIRVQLHQYVRGGSSKKWEITPHFKMWSNELHLRYSWVATYWCGVNIKGGRDHLCGKGASHSPAVLHENKVNAKGFEYTNGNIVFPMVQMETFFSNDRHASVKFRGCDVRNYIKTTRLVSPLSKSGDGS